MPTVFAFNGTVFGWGVSDADRADEANGRLKWAPGLSTSAQKGTARALAHQTVVLAFVPAASGYAPLDDHRLRLVIGSSAQVDVNKEDNPTGFEFLSDGTVLVTIADTRMAALSPGRHPIEFWDTETDQPIATGTLTLVASVMPA